MSFNIIHIHKISRIEQLWYKYFSTHNIDGEKKEITSWPNEITESQRLLSFVSCRDALSHTFCSTDVREQTIVCVIILT